MNPLIFLLSFSPWIVFGVLAGHSLVQLEIALAASMILAFIVGYKDLTNRMVVAWSTCIYFVIVNLLVTGLHQYGVIPYIGVASNTVLTVIAFGTLAIGMPFTLQYAKQSVPEDRWKNPQFIRINQVMTAFWGVMFLIGLTNSIIEFYYPDSLGIWGDASMWVTIVIGIIFTMKYPDYAKSRAAHRTE